MASPDLTADGAAIWRWLLDPDAADAVPAQAEEMAKRLAFALSPALAAFLLDPLARRLGRPLIDPAAAANALRLGRFTGHRQRAVVARLAGLGIPFVCIKGFASAHTLYPDPDLRTFGDLDLVVRPGDRAALVDALRADGFAFRPLPRPWWGLAPRESAPPLVAADGGCNVDVHTAPDADPLPRALDAAALVAGAQTIAMAGGAMRVPAPEHAVLIQVSNIAKDKFGPFAIRKVVDLARLMASRADRLDWGAIAQMAMGARLARPFAATMSLLATLGQPTATLPPWPASRGPSSDVLARVLDDWRVLRSEYPGPRILLDREWRLGADWPVPLQRAWRRALGPLGRDRAGAFGG